MRLGALARVLFALVGLAATAALVASEGASALGSALAAALPALPACAALEVGRVSCEALAARSADAEKASRPALARLWLAQLVGHAFLTVAPAPRTAAEAAKATLLAGDWGPARAAAIGASVQGATLFAVAAMSAAGCAATLARGVRGALPTTMGANAVGVGVAGLGFVLALRSKRVAGWVARALAWPRVARRWPGAGASFALFGEACAGRTRVALPAACLVGSMLCQVTQLALLAHHVAGQGSATGAFAAFGAQLVAASVAVAVPGQLGVREASFVLAAEAIGTTPARAASIALAWRAVQLSFALAGFATLAAWRARRSRA